MIVEIGLFVILIFLIVQYDRKPKGLPPGPWGLPVLGDLSTGGILTIDNLNEMKKKYGNVFSQRVGSLFCVYITDFETIRSTLSKPECQGRPFYYPMNFFHYFKNIGIVDAVGEIWSSNRRFTLKQLRDLGLGKTRMQDSIQFEAEELVAFFGRQNGKPTDLGFEVNVAILNVIWQLIANTRFDVEDDKMKFFMKLMTSNFEICQGPTVVLGAFPWVEKILPSAVLTKLFNMKPMYLQRTQINELMDDIIKEHVEKHDPENPKDFIDHFLIDIGKTKISDMSENEYMNLRITILDLFAAGSETTSSALRWVVLLLATHPEIQKKMQTLVDDVIPRDRTPSMEDREKLTYVDAVLMEIMRFSSFAGQGLPHAATEDTEIGGYSIPKGSAILPCLEMCHYSTEHFENPTEFNPNHFIGENGELLSKKQGYLPFALGRRVCPGESLAKIELFIFTTAILQSFTIEPHPDHPLDIGFDKTKPLFNFTKPFKVCFNKR